MRPELYGSVWELWDPKLLQNAHYINNNVMKSFRKGNSYFYTWLFGPYFHVYLMFALKA